MASMAHPLELARSRLQGRRCRIVFPEGDDTRIRQAARQLVDTFPDVEAVLLGRETPDPTMPRIRTIDPESSDATEALSRMYLSNRPGTSQGVARRFARKPMYHAGLMLKAGLADCMVAGVTCPTARVIEAAMLTIGLADGVAVPSSFFLMLPHPAVGREPTLFADCAVNVSPSMEELAAIGVASAHSWQRLMGTPPLTAFLSFSTQGSASHQAAGAVREAAAMAAAQCPAFHFQGELQADAALNPRIAGLKVREPGPVAGHANVLVFPDLGAANISYKLLQELGGATALGPFLQGFAHPVSDLSRGATVQDIVETSIITASLSLDHVA
jgi:phosphate acetyltransferase